MMDLNARYDEFVKKLNSMSSEEFDEMLIHCGIERIKPSIESDYISCIRRSFSKKNEEYSMGSEFNSDAYRMDNRFDLESGQGAA